MNPRAVVQAWVEAFNRRDLDALCSLYHEQAVNHQVVREPVIGRAAIRSMLAREFAAAAEMTCLPERIFEDGDWAFVEWRDPKRLRGCGFFQTKAGQIVFQRGYWDQSSFQQLHNVPR